MRVVRIFLSSPNDLKQERNRIVPVVERLNSEFGDLISFQLVRWESRVYQAHDSYQPQIAEAADCDIVIGLFWSRLGTPLPDTFPARLPDGSAYPSGTAYEILSALERRRETRTRPDIYVFRKTVIPTVAVNDAGQQEVAARWNAVEAFFQRWFETADRRILRVAEKFAVPDQLAEKVELILREWVDTNVPRGVVWSIEQKGSPFRSLEPFDARHADVFCGRERKVVRAVEELERAAARGTPFLLIPGASGAGKSSLVRAGLAPRLIRPAGVPGVDGWRVAVMRPAEAADPFHALARALHASGAAEDDPGGFGRALPELAMTAFDTVEKVTTLLAGSPEAASVLIVATLDQIAHEQQALQGRGTRPRINLLLLVDQLEDIFADKVTAKQRGDFADLMATFAETGRIWIVSTLRADLYGRIHTERRLGALKDAGAQYDLFPPGPEELEAILFQSAQASGLAYETDAGGRRLDDVLLSDAVGENTLPLLQFTLDLLFQKCCAGGGRILTFSAYREIGGLDGALDKTAEGALARLSERSKAAEGRGGAGLALAAEGDREVSDRHDPVLANLLRRLVGPVGREMRETVPGGAVPLTGRVVDYAAATSDEASRLLVEALLDARILSASRSRGGARAQLQLAHDRVLTGWKRARAITRQNETFYRTREWIEEQMARWVESGGRRDLLIPTGLPLSQAEHEVRSNPTSFSEEAIAYVRKSGRRGRIVRMLSAGAVAAIAILALALALFYGESQRNLATAEHNYQVARDAGQDMVVNVATRLRNLEGMRLEAIETILATAKKLIADLQKRSQGGPDLDLVEARMRYEFAKTLRDAKYATAALPEADAGFEISERLAKRFSHDPDWQWQYALSLDQIGDIHRDTAVGLVRAGGPGAEPEFEAARAAFQRAFDIRTRLAAEEPGKPLFSHGLALSQTRLGDLAMQPDKQPAKAQAAYSRASEIAQDLFRREPDNPDWQRELSWSYRKLGELAIWSGQPDVALRHQLRSLCIRRHIALRNEHQTLFKTDLAFSLDTVSAAMVKTGDLAGARLASHEALSVRRELSGDDPFNSRRRLEMAGSMKRLAELYEAEAPDVAVGFFLFVRDIERGAFAAPRVAAPPPNPYEDKITVMLATIKARTGAPPSVTDLREKALAEMSDYDRTLKLRQNESLACWDELVAELGAAQSPGAP